MAVKIGHASISEKGTITGNAGDQTGREVYTRNWYKHSKGWVTLRCKDAKMREYIAEAMEKACANNDIGYDQYENSTLWNNVKGKGFDPGKTTKKVETDCARLVRVCVQYACEKMGLKITIPDFYTATLANTLVKTGLFEKLTASKYNTQDAYLLRGDIQVTKTKGHTWIILGNGKKVNAEDIIETEFVEYDLGVRILRNGSEGADVKELQGYLIQLGYSCGSYGADGDFGDATEQAVEAFQKEYDLTVDGEYGPKTHAAMTAALSDTVVKERYVRIIGGNCYVRTEPNTSGEKLGVAYEGARLQYQGQTSENGWRLVVYKNKNAWVSGKYSKIEG